MGGGRGRVPGGGTAQGAGGSLVPQPPAVATPDRGGGGPLHLSSLATAQGGCRRVGRQASGCRRGPDAAGERGGAAGHVVR